MREATKVIIAAVNLAPCKINTSKNDTSSHHFWSEAETSAYVDWINSQLGDDPDLAHVLPIPKQGTALFEACNDGILLAKLVNSSVENTINLKLLTKNCKSPIHKSENLIKVIAGCKEIGVKVHNIGPGDIMKATPHLCLGIVWQIIKVGLLANIQPLAVSPGSADNLAAFGSSLDKGLNQTTFSHTRAPSSTMNNNERNLLQWFNKCIEKQNYSGKVANFGTDLSDSIALAHLVAYLTPSSIEKIDLKSVSKEANLYERAEQVLSAAQKFGCRAFASASDIVDGSKNLNMAFVAVLYNTRAAATAAELKAVQLEDDLSDANVEAKRIREEKIQVEADLRETIENHQAAGEKLRLQVEESENLSKQISQLKNELSVAINERDQAESKAQNNLNEISNVLSEIDNLRTALALQQSHSTEVENKLSISHAENARIINEQAIIESQSKSVADKFNNDATYHANEIGMLRTLFEESEGQLKSKISTCLELESQNALAEKSFIELNNQFKEHQVVSVAASQRTESNVTELESRNAELITQLELAQQDASQKIDGLIHDVAMSENRYHDLKSKQHEQYLGYKVETKRADDDFALLQSKYEALETQLKLDQKDAIINDSELQNDNLNENEESLEKFQLATLEEDRKSEEVELIQRQEIESYEKLRTIEQELDENTTQSVNNPSTLLQKLHINISKIKEQTLARQNNKNGQLQLESQQHRVLHEELGTNNVQPQDRDLETSLLRGQISGLVIQNNALLSSHGSQKFMIEQSSFDSEMAIINKLEIMIVNQYRSSHQISAGAGQPSSNEQVKEGYELLTKLQELVYQLKEHAVGRGINIDTVKAEHIEKEVVNETTSAAEIEVTSDQNEPLKLVNTFAIASTSIINSSHITRNIQTSTAVDGSIFELQLHDANAKTEDLQQTLDKVHNENSTLRLQIALTAGQIVKSSALIGTLESRIYVLEAQSNANAESFIIKQKLDASRSRLEALLPTIAVLAQDHPLSAAHQNIDNQDKKVAASEPNGAAQVVIYKEEIITPSITIEEKKEIQPVELRSTIDGDMKDLSCMESLVISSINSSVFDAISKIRNSVTSQNGGGRKILKQQNLARQVATEVAAEERQKRIEIQVDFEMSDEKTKDLELEIRSLKNNLVEIHQEKETFREKLFASEGVKASLAEENRFILASNLEISNAQELKLDELKTRLERSERAIISQIASMEITVQDECHQRSILLNQLGEAESDIKNYATEVEQLKRTCSEMNSVKQTLHASIVTMEQDVLSEKASNERLQLDFHGKLTEKELVIKVLTERTVILQKQNTQNLLSLGEGDHKEQRQQLKETEEKVAAALVEISSLNERLSKIAVERDEFHSKLQSINANSLLQRQESDANVWKITSDLQEKENVLVSYRSKLQRLESSRFERQKSLSEQECSDGTTIIRLKEMLAVCKLRADDQILEIGILKETKVNLSDENKQFAMRIASVEMASEIYKSELNGEYEKNLELISQKEKTISSLKEKLDVASRMGIARRIVVEAAALESFDNSQLREKLNQAMSQVDDASSQAEKLSESIKLSETFSESLKIKLLELEEESAALKRDNHKLLKSSLNNLEDQQRVDLKELGTKLASAERQRSGRVIATETAATENIERIKLQSKLDSAMRKYEEAAKLTEFLNTEIAKFKSNAEMHQLQEVYLKLRAQQGESNNPQTPIPDECVQDTKTRPTTAPQSKLKTSVISRLKLQRPKSAK